MSKKVYTLNYWLKNPEGEVVDTSDGGTPMVFIDGSKLIIPGLQQAVQGRNVGDRLDVTIPPELAYGAHNPSLVNDVSASMFDGIDQVVPGMKFQTNTGAQTQVVKVVSVDGDTVRVDANHPLAGLTLNFEIEIINIRDASDEEAAGGEAVTGS